MALSKYSFLDPLSSSYSAISNSMSVISLNSLRYSCFDLGFTIVIVRTVTGRIKLLCPGRIAQKSE